MPSLRFLIVPCVLTLGSVFQVNLSHGDGAIDYLRTVKPLLAEKCLPCHGVLKQEAGLRLDTSKLMVEAGVVVPGKPKESELLARIASDADDRMPPPEEGAKLTVGEREALASWIAAGAIGPSDEIAAEGPESHWAFQSIVSHDVDASTTGVQTIDGILEEGRLARGLQTVDTADRKLALRRLYLDLVGLPPTLEQLSDTRHWTEIVDALLADPRHAERWARHWMDVWRYSDWYGLGDQLRNSQKHIWHWRDWIIESIQADKGYDRMILEMLAGDELDPDNPEVVRATGFLARNYYLFNRTTWLDSTIEHTGKAFLGLTFNCAKCHDHKYDPISHVDYYRMRAIFEPHQVRLDPIAGETNLDIDAIPRAYDDNLETTTLLHRKGNPADPDLVTQITPGVLDILNDFEPSIVPVSLPTTAFAPLSRTSVQHDLITAAESRLTTALANQSVDLIAAETLALEALQLVLEAEQRKLATSAIDEEYQEIAKSAAVKQCEAELARAKYQLTTVAGTVTGDEAKQKDAEATVERAEEKLAKANSGEISYQPPRVTRKALETPEHTDANYTDVFPKTSSGRRTALAKWIVDARNPLTARVAVNHVWLRHFGKPLVETVDDFGLRAKRPEQIKLLDFLASELVDSGWSLKHLHRLIVTSNAYQLSSSTTAADPATMAADPDNVYYWRMNTKRMESQVVRDSLLSLADQLDLSMGGPSVNPGPTSRRRSVYFKHSRDDQDQFLNMFDDADHLQCYQRSESIVPQQALALANSELSISMAELTAQKLSAMLDDRENSSSTTDFIGLAFSALLGRPPLPEEQSACKEFYESLRQLDNDTTQTSETKIQARLVHALFNHNDFVTIR